MHPPPSPTLNGRHHSTLKTSSSINDGRLGSRQDAAVRPRPPFASPFFRQKKAPSSILEDASFPQGREISP